MAGARRSATNRGGAHWRKGGGEEAVRQWRRTMVARAQPESEEARESSKVRGGGAVCYGGALSLL
jgi:hypothetical protein